MMGESLALAGMPALFKKATEPTRGCIFYLHGGGLVYGSPSDYPESFARRLTGIGFDFLALGYPLAPEATLCEQIASVVAAYRQAADRGLVDPGDLVAFGRSGGAFLWIAAMAELQRQRLPLPGRFISLYGYASLGRVDPWHADLRYRPDVMISAETAFSLIASQPVHDDPEMRRVLLYVFARQHGLIGELLGVNEEGAADYCFEDRLCLPPTFAAWSVCDTEVPPISSTAICHMAAKSECFIVSEARHDFDQRPDTPDSRAFMDRLVEWLVQS